MCVSVLLNTLDTTVSIQRGKKLGYALPMKTEYEETQNLKRYNVKDCPNHADKDKILISFQCNPKRMMACQAAQTFRKAPRHANWNPTNRFCMR